MQQRDGGGPISQSAHFRSQAWGKTQETTSQNKKGELAPPPAVAQAPESTQHSTEHEQN